MSKCPELSDFMLTSINFSNSWAASLLGQSCFRMPIGWLALVVGLRLSINQLHKFLHNLGSAPISRMQDDKSKYTIYKIIKKI
jgi:hypothetical protein